MEKKYKVGIYINVVLTIICAVIIVLGMVSNNTPNLPAMSEGEVVDMPAAEGPAFEQPSSTFNVYNLVKPATLLLVVYYTVIGYKKPHGNLLKYIMLLFAASLLININGAVNFNMTTNAMIYAIVMSFIAYIAGRLNRIEQNKYYVVIVLACLLFTSITSFTDAIKAGNVIHSLSEFVTPVLWCDICSAYFIRYLQHKEAGLQEK